MSSIPRLVLVLGAICLASAASLAMMNDLTREPIAFQQKLELALSLQAVLPGQAVDPEGGFLDLPGDRPGGKEETVRVYRAFAEGEGAFSGAAFQVVAPDGYSGRIGILLGILSDGRLGGVVILSHAETPGLGSLIAGGKWRSQFPGKSLADTDFRVKKDGGDIDQLTGATISPRAVTAAVKKGLEWFERNREAILAAPATVPPPSGKEPPEIPGGQGGAA